MSAVAMLGIERVDSSPSSATSSNENGRLSLSTSLLTSSGINGTSLTTSVLTSREQDGLSSWSASLSTSEEDDSPLSTSLMTSSEDNGSTSSSPSHSSQAVSTTLPRKSWEKPYDLPPCKVCGGKGTGFHYGVNTCEPCKVFFRRVLNKGQRKRCRQNDQCQLVDGKKNICAQCRFKKCLDVGMSVQGIKNGRYTLDKKFADLKDLQRQRAERAQVTALVQEERIRPSLEKTVSTLYSVNQRFADLWEPLQEKLIHMDVHFIRKHGVQRNMCADMTSLVPGDRRLSFLNEVLSLSEQIARYTVRFVKQLPGYRDLHIDDQVVLLQESWGETRLVNTYRLMAPSAGLISDDLMRKMMGDDAARLTFSIAKRLLSLSLKPEELAVLTALLIFDADRAALLKDRDKVAVFNSQLVDTLRWLLQRNHPEDKLCLPKLVSVLTDLKTLNETHLVIYRDMLALADNGTIRLPPLVREICPQAAKAGGMSSQAQ